MILVKANNFSIHWRAIPDLLGYVWVHIDTSVWNPSYELRWKSVLVALICYLNRLKALKQLGAIRLSVVIFAMDFCLEGPLIMTFCCSIFRVLWCSLMSHVIENYVHNLLCGRKWTLWNAGDRSGVIIYRESNLWKYPVKREKFHFCGCWPTGTPTYSFFSGLESKGFCVSQLFFFCFSF